MEKNKPGKRETGNGMEDYGLSRGRVRKSFFMR